MSLTDERLDIYTDYLLSDIGLATATDLSAILDGEVSHDVFTRLLREETFGSKEVWQRAKPMVRAHESAEGVLIFDDTIGKKPYSEENGLISWHWDHSENRHVKGIGLLSAFYQSEGLSVPVGHELIEKDQVYHDEKTGRQKRRSSISKNARMRRMLAQAITNRICFKYVLADSWFTSKANLKAILEHGKSFIFEIKTNRLVACSEQERQAGQWTRIDELEIEPNSQRVVWLKGIDQPLSLNREVFKNEDGSQGQRYLISDDLDLDFDQISTIYQKRWSVETYHKSIKQHAAFEKSPTKTIRSQRNHCCASLIAYLKLEAIRLAKQLNHYALKAKVFLKAQKIAFKELLRFKQESEFSICRA